MARRAGTMCTLMRSFLASALFLYNSLISGAVELLSTT